MTKVILIILLIIFSYTLGEDNGKKETTKLIKQYWEESKDIDEFWAKFTILWENNVGSEKDDNSKSR